MKYVLLTLVVLVVSGMAVLALAYLRQQTVWVKDRNTPRALSDVPEAAWARLAGTRILFAHMSVGENILAGVDELLRAHPEIGLQVRQWDGKSPITEPGLWHARVGFNGEPIAKMTRFAEMMKSLEPNPPGIALMKLCYVDVQRETDIVALQRTYRRVTESLQAAFPETAFVHATIPLQSVSPSLGSRVKRGLLGLVGRPDPVDDNAQREQYNRWLRDSYSIGMVFDLALIGATGDAGICQASRSGTQVLMLGAEYTHDGGHLNDAGRRRVAEQFLIALAQAGQEVDRVRDDN